MDATLAKAIFKDSSRAFAVKLWDDTILDSSRDAAPGSRVVLRNPAALQALGPFSSERLLAEAYMDDRIELEGDTVRLLEAVVQWKGPGAIGSLVAMALGAREDRVKQKAIVGLAARLKGRRHSPGLDGEAVRHHYDRSHEIYRVFLDSTLTYSCAYYPRGEESLEEAQRAKHELICRKLDLTPKDRLLDVGCGWGGLLLHAGSHYGVTGVGITLSRSQFLETRRRLSEMEAPPNVGVRVCDYRELDANDKFHKAASVGMMEHVGASQLDDYFRRIYDVLQPGGLFLNHAIADTTPGVRLVPWVPRRRRGFLDYYIFPDSEVVPVSRVIRSAESAGFEVRDVESLREHYAETLTHWLDRFDKGFVDAVRVMGRRDARAWRLYLAGVAVAFRMGLISVFQVLLAKQTPDGRLPGSPRCRARWYESDRLQRRPPSASNTLGARAAEEPA